MTSCQECGFVYEEIAARQVAARVAALPAQYRSELGGTTDERVITARPSPEVWSALEYTCHIRDVLLVQRDRLVVALVEECPAFLRMYRDERVSVCGYSSQTTAEALAQLQMAADLLAMAFSNLDDAQWQRPLYYSSGQLHDVTWMGQHTVHEGVHHLMDVHRCLGQ